MAAAASDALLRRGHAEALGQRFRQRPTRLRLTTPRVATEVAPTGSCRSLPVHGRKALQPRHSPRAMRSLLRSSPLKPLAASSWVHCGRHFTPDCIRRQKIRTLHSSRLTSLPQGAADACWCSAVVFLAPTFAANGAIPTSFVAAEAAPAGACDRLLGPLWEGLQSRLHPTPENQTAAFIPTGIAPTGCCGCLAHKATTPIIAARRGAD